MSELEHKYQMSKAAEKTIFPPKCEAEDVAPFVPNTLFCDLQADRKRDEKDFMYLLFF